MTFKIKNSFKLLVVILFCYVLPSLGFASPSNHSVLRSCQEKVYQTVEHLGDININSQALLTIPDCVGVLIELSDPSLAETHGANIEAFRCGAGCWLKHHGYEVDGVNFVAGEATYLEKVAEQLTSKEIDLIDRYYDGGIERIVKKAYNKVGFKWYRGYEILKVILIDVVDAFVRASLQKFGEKKNSLTVKTYSEKYSLALQSCFSVANKKNQILYCVNQLKFYASADTGKVILDTYANKYFAKETSPKNYKYAKEKIDEEYYSCILSYYFSLDDGTSFTEKATACAYSGMLVGFNAIVKQTVRDLLPTLDESGEVTEERLEEIVNRATRSCPSAGVINPITKDASYYELLSQQKIETIISVTESCKDKSEVFVVKELARFSIAQNQDIKGIVGKGDVASSLADNVLAKYYDQCLDLLKLAYPEALPRHCAHYLAAASVFELAENHLEGKVSELLVELAGLELSANDVSGMLKVGNQSMVKCKKETFQSMINDYDQDKKTADERITSCLSMGIVAGLNMVIGSAVKKELTSNAIIQKYGVVLDESALKQVIYDFNLCFQNSLKSYKSMKSLISGAETSVKSCKLPAMKDVVSFVLDTVLEQELNGAGLSESQTRGVIDTYKSRNSNLYKSIMVAKSFKEIELLTKGADYKVIEAIAYNVIYLLIRKKTKGYLSKAQTKSYARAAKDEVIACAATRALGDCQKEITPHLMSKIIIELLPSEVEKIFAKETSSLLTAKQRAKINVAGTVRWWVTPGNTETGRTLIDYMVTEISRGQSIEQVQSSAPVRTKIYTVLSTSEKFFARFLNEIIQPELDKRKDDPEFALKRFGVRTFRKNGRQLWRNMFVWKNINKTRSGLLVGSKVKHILENIIVRKKKFTNQDMKEIVSLVTSAITEYYNGTKRSSVSTKRERVSTEGSSR